MEMKMIPQEFQIVTATYENLCQTLEKFSLDGWFVVTILRSSGTWHEVLLQRQNPQSRRSFNVITTQLNLLPCVCGSPQILSPWHYSWVICNKCPVEVVGNTEQQAITMWNAAMRALNAR